MLQQDFDEMVIKKMGTIPTSYDIFDKIHQKMKEIKLSVEDFNFEYYNFKYTVIPTYGDYKNVIEKVTFDVNVSLKKQTLQPTNIKMWKECVEFQRPEDGKDFIPIEFLTENDIIDWIKETEFEYKLVTQNDVWLNQVAKTDVIMEYDGFVFSE